MSQESHDLAAELVRRSEAAAERREAELAAERDAAADSLDEIAAPTFNDLVHGLQPEEEDDGSE